MAKLKLSDVNKKRLRILGYLVVSGFLGWLSATYIANNESLSLIFGAGINFVIYSVIEELKGEGYTQIIRQSK